MDNQKESNYKNTPIKPGLYWAKKDSSYGQYNLIIEIYGDISYLRWRGWDKGKDIIIEGNAKPDFIFGNEIIDPGQKIPSAEEKIKNDDFALKNEIILFRNKLYEDFEKVTCCNHYVYHGKREIYAEVIKQLNTIINQSTE